VADGAEVTRLAFAADLHLGAGERLADQRAAWVEACEFAASSADALIVAGDIFHRARPTPEELAAFAAGLDAVGVVHAIPGNHDFGERVGITALEVIAKARDWVSVYMTPDVVQIGDALVGFLPWTPTKPTPDELVRIALGLRAKRPPFDSDIDLDRLLVAHWAISGSSLPNGASVEEVLRREPIIPADMIEACDFALALAGHIHKAQTMRPGVAYIGSLMPVDFSEADDEHGLVLWDSTRPREFTRRTIGSRQLVTIDAGRLDADGLGFEELANTIAELDEGAIVRVKYEATPDEHRRVDAGMIADLVAHAGGTLASVMPTIERAENQRGELLDEDATPVEQMQAWLAEQAGLDAATMQRMIDETARYVAEEAGS